MPRKPRQPTSASRRLCDERLGQGRKQDAFEERTANWDICALVNYACDQIERPAFPSWRGRLHKFVNELRQGVNLGVARTAILRCEIALPACPQRICERHRHEGITIIPWAHAPWNV